MAKDPAFMFYTNDWLSSTIRVLMSPAQRGAYIDLLCHQWNDETCSLPDDDEVLAVLSGLGEGWLNGSCDLLRRCFPKSDTLVGRIANKKLLELKDERDAWKEKCRKGGLKSSKNRKLRSVKGSSTTVATKRELKGNSSSSSSSSIIDDTNVSSTKPTKVAVATSDFDTFWNAILKIAPHKAKAKAETAKRYAEALALLRKRGEPSPTDFLRQRAEAYYASDEGQTQYANGPAPWLNKGRYDDDPSAWARSQKFSGHPQTGDDVGYVDLNFDLDGD